MSVVEAEPKVTPKRSYSLLVIAPDGSALKVAVYSRIKYAGLVKTHGRWRVVAGGSSPDAVIKRILRDGVKFTELAVRRYVRVK